MTVLTVSTGAGKISGAHSNGVARFLGVPRQPHREAGRWPVDVCDERSSNGHPLGVAVAGLLIGHAVDGRRDGSQSRVSSRFGSVAPSGLLLVRGTESQLTISGALAHVRLLGPSPWELGVGAVTA
jgi:hypothetical protein